MNRTFAQLDFVRRPDAVPTARAILRELLTLAGCARRELEDLLVAVSEACTNVIEHACESERLRIGLEASADVVEIQVSDDGAGRIDDHPSMPDASATEGRGLALMHSLVDHVTIRTVEGVGTEVRLRHPCPTATTATAV